MELLEGLRLRPEYLKLFRAIVVSAWERRHADIVEARKAKKELLAAIEERKARLVDAFVYQQAIDAAAYSKALAKLDDEMAFVSADSIDNELELAEVKGILDFAEHVVSRPARASEEFGFDSRLRFQKIVFPEGTAWEPRGGFIEPVISPIFSFLREIQAQEPRMVAPTGIEPVFRP